MEDVKEILCRIRSVAFEGITDKAYPVEKFREIRDLANEAVAILDKVPEKPTLKRKKKGE